jgi:DNA-binding YbaB/EbfC family protein
MQGLGEELKLLRATGSAGAGMVEVEVNGLGELLACRLDPALVAKQDRELLEDLIVAASNQALVKARQLHAEAMKGLAGGLELPGLDEALSKMTGELNEPE